MFCLMKTRVSGKGCLVLPASLLELDGIVAGQEFQIERVQAGHYRLKRASHGNTGLVGRLRSCPEKGWFKAVDSESTASP